MVGIAIHSSGKWSPRNPTHGVFRYWWEGAILSRPYRARLVSSLGECLRTGAQERSDVHRAGLRGKMFDDGLCIEREQRISGRHTTSSDVMKLWLIILIPWLVFKRQLSFRFLDRKFLFVDWFGLISQVHARVMQPAEAYWCSFLQPQSIVNAKSQSMLTTSAPGNDEGPHWGSCSGWHVWFRDCWDVLCRTEC